MRYLFRGKTKKGEWVYGLLGCNYYRPNEKYYYIHNCETDDTEYEVIPETVGQFTGLTDKNGKKIFEGDIVKAIQTEYDEDKEKEPFSIEVIGEMIFEDACFGLREKRVFSFYAPMWQEDNVELEVIGNIHDNPDLLKDKENE